MDDQQIVALYRKRDEQAVMETERAYGGYCFTIAMNILGCREDASEVVLDTWMQAWSSIPPQEPKNLKLYLARIARNLSLSRWRMYHASKRGGGQVLVALEELGDCVCTDTDASQTLDKKELGRCINQFLLRQPHRDRAVFLRRYFHLDDTACIANRYGLRESNVLQILSRTRRKLKQYLIQEGYDL